MTYLWAIRIEDQLFSGYQRRKLLVFGLSASMMTWFRVISVEDDLFLGYQCRRWLLFELHMGGWAHTRRCDSGGGWSFVQHLFCQWDVCVSVFFTEFWQHMNLYFWGYFLGIVVHPRPQEQMRHSETNPKSKTSSHNRTHYGPLFVFFIKGITGDAWWMPGNAAARPPLLK